MALPGPSLKGRALRLLAQREHSRVELTRKLAPHVQEGEDLDAVLDALQAKGFISEQRVAESVLHRRAPKLGAQRIRQELQAKGLDAELIREAVTRLQGSELARAREVWLRRFGVPAEDAAGRARQMRFLAARGFAAETIRRVVAGAADEDS